MSLSNFIPNWKGHFQKRILRRDWQGVQISQDKIETCWNDQTSDWRYLIHVLFLTDPVQSRNLLRFLGTIIIRHKLVYQSSLATN